MAYVRKTETLVTEMRDVVRSMGRKAVQPYESQNIEDGNPIFQSLRTAISDAAWSLAPELRDKMPEKWTKNVDKVYARFVDANGEKTYGTYLETGEHNKVKVPQDDTSSYYRYDVDVKAEHCNEQLTQWLSEEGDREKKREEVTKQYATIERQLKAFMEQHASLNAAIKEMPEIEMYVPAQYLAKLAEPSPKRSKKTQDQTNVEEIGIDRDVFASAAIAHRIATAAE